ncbi:MAG: phosphoenolpyruvate--protein phosphotransferase [Nocardioidaceae bacterium]
MGGAAGPGILVIPELDAATAATLDVAQVLGIITRQGGTTGHGIIVAKSRGIPLFTDAGEQLDAVVAGSLVGFDARTGELWVDPDEDEAEELRNEIESRTRNRERAFAQAREPAVTRDGCRITVAANVTSVDDAAAALIAGADGSGLVRTEVLFGARRSVPSIEEQTQQFLAVAAALSGQSITIRTWDVGGDKPLRFLPQPREANPFLGERGLRLFRRQPDVLVDQLRAVCRAAQQTPVKVMFPMVSSAAEVTWALNCLAEAASNEHGGMPADLKVGVMVEVPAAALAARRVAAQLDFVSIGTNDLTQYTMAAERGNAAVSHLAKAFDPAVLRLVRLVCEEVPPTVEVAVCGDLASNPAGAVLLVGLGVREVSVVAPAVPEVKAGLRRVSLSDAEAVGRRALEASGADEVSALLQSLDE